MSFSHHAEHFPPAFAVQPDLTGLRRQQLGKALLVLAALFAVVPTSDAAPKVSERSKQKQAAEAERAQLRKKLSNLKRDISQTESAKSHAADALANSEAAISTANRSLRELAEEQKLTAARLAQLSQHQARLAKTVDTRQQQLAKLLREQYVAGNEDRIKLLLSGDNPNRINRDLQYMGYVARAQAKLVESLRASLQEVEKNQADTEQAKHELDEIAQEERAQTAVLEKEKAKRATLLSQLANKLASQRKQAGNLQHDEQRLGSLVDKLALLIEEQRKADAADAKRRQAARAAKDRPKAPVRPGAGGGKPVNPNAIDADEAPRKSLVRNELIPEPDVNIDAFAQSFSALRGQLRLPVRGDLIARFGSKRGDGPSWKGLFIGAAEGAEVRAVAGGKVIFADWLRGFGNLIIVDHGSQYMTIYGNNQAVLKQPGATIRTGDVIASAGNSGGNEQSGLYFEMRHQGRAFDPLTWMSGTVGQGK